MVIRKRVALCRGAWADVGAGSYRDAVHLENRTKQTTARRNHFLPPAKSASSCRSVPLQAVFLGLGSIMWILINILYQEYCRARLAEMRHLRASRLPGVQEIDPQSALPQIRHA
jgi:hypothetical protein